MFLTIKKNKKFIFLFTMIITVLALAYVFIKTPLYEATALVKIGNYKLNNNNNKVLLDNAYQLTKELNVIFIDMHKNDKNVKSKIISINVPKNQKGFIEIKAQAISNSLAVRNINKVVTYIRTKDQKILDDVSERRKFEISNITRKIANIKDKEIVMIDSKIHLQAISLISYRKQAKLIDDNIKKIENKNPALAALKLMEKRDLSEFILKLNLQLIDLRDKKDNLSTTVIADLQEKRNLLRSMLLPHNYKNSYVVGSVLTNDYPIKPKKKLIVVVAFITGLILSIFLVFFMEFLKGLKEEV